MGQNEQRALIVATLALGFSTLALASAPRWAACISAAIALMAVVPLAGSRRVLKERGALLLLLFIPLVATAIQLLPLPAELVGVVAPASYDLAEANARAYGHSMPGLIPLSQDWPATLVEIAKFAGYFAFAYVCSRLCISRRAREWLLVSVCCVGALVALCALGHRAAGAKSLLGLYTPEVSYPQSISPFFNPNHLAGYLAFVTPVCLGMAAHRRSWLFLAMAALCAIGSIQAVSRGGIVSLSIGVMIALVLIAKSAGAARTTHGRKRLWVVLAIGLAFVAVAVFGASAGHQLLELDLQREQDSGKFLAWSLAPALLATSPWVGVGRGAFEFSFTRFQPSTGVTFSHVENEYLQVVLDWGVPVALAMLFASFLLARSLLRRGSMDALAAGGFGAMAALLVQNSVDFGLQMPGVVLPAIVVVASLLPAKLAVVKDKKRRRIVHGQRLAAVVVAMFICAMAASGLGARADTEIAGSPEFAPEFSGDSERILAAASRISRRHPSSYLLAAKVAKALWLRRDAAAFAAMSRALWLNSSHPGIHLLAAEMLASSQQPRQALAEYRAALAISGPRANLLKSMESYFPTAEDLLLVVPEDPVLVGRFGAAFLQIGRPDAAEALARRAIERGNTSFAIYRAGVQAALKNGNPDWAVVAAKAAHSSYPSEESLLLYASTLAATDSEVLAIRVLEADSSKSLKVLDMLGKLQVDTEDWDGAMRTSQQLMSAAGTSRPFRRIAHTRLATIEERKGNRHKADWHRQQATALTHR